MLTSLLDGRIMAARHGSGPPSVVALHGWSRDSSDWDDVLRGEDALALDLPGFGNTPGPDAAWGTPEYAEVVVDAICSAAATPVTLVGHSFGGRVAVRIAASRPELIAGLVLTGAPLYRRAAPAKPLATFRAAKVLHRAGILSDALMDRMRHRYGSADYRATSGVMRALFVKVINESYDAPIMAISASEVPVFLVWGEHDQEVPLSVASRIHAAIDGSTLRVVPGAGHLLDRGLHEELKTAIANSKAFPAHN
jgi:pimeloyl-ACP methyl ester carboxylesterase